MPLECNRENMTRLVNALESGEFEQGRHTLRTDDNKFCCLGVACEISGLGYWMKREGEGHPWAYVTYEGYSSGTMPKPVQEWLGLERPGDTAEWDQPDVDALPLSPQEEPGFFGGKVTTYNYATTLNDEGETFAQIAQRIRETYLTEDAPA